MTSVCLRFSSDMPPAAVEVIGPNLAPVERLMMRGGGSQELKMPPKSFVRIHLPDGRVAVISDPAKLDKPITPEMVRRGDRVRRTGAVGTRAVVHEHPHVLRRNPANEFVGAVWNENSRDFTSVPFGQRWQWQIREVHQTVPRWQWRFVSPSPAPRDLVGTMGPVTITVRLPGTVTIVRVAEDRHSPIEHQQRVTVKTSSDLADAMMNFLYRGERDNAETLLSSIDLSGYADHIADPYVAVAAAYVLLRRKRFEDLARWSARLANDFPRVPDGALINAWVALNRNAELSPAARAALLEVVNNGQLPVYAEGLRLLMDGLRIVGNDNALTQLQSFLGMIVWTSPLTAQITVTDVRSQVPSIAVAFESQ